MPGATAEQRCPDPTGRTLPYRAGCGDIDGGDPGNPPPELGPAGPKGPGVPGGCGALVPRQREPAGTAVYSGWAESGAPGLVYLHTVRDPGPRQRGKPGKVALAAVMRKLLLQLNAVARRGTPWVPITA